MNKFFKSDITRTAREVIDAVHEEIVILNEHPDAVGYKTGLKSLDQHFKHTFVPGSFGLLAGATGSGKTVMANQLALTLSSQSWVQIFTLEDNAEATMKRNLANFSRIDVGQIRGAFGGGEIPKTFDDALEGIANNPNLGFVDKVQLNVLEVFLAIYLHWRDTRKKTTGVVIVDQLSMLSPTLLDDDTMQFCNYFGLPYPPGPRARDDQNIAWAGKVLEVAAQKMNLLVIGVSQLNASKNLSEEPDEHSLSASKALAHHAAFVLIPWVPRKLREENPHAGKGEPKFTERDNVLGEAFIIGVKNRNGSRFKAKATFVGEYQVFVDAGEESMPFKLPAARSQSAIEGVNKLTALRNRLMQEAQQRVDSSAGIESGEQIKELTSGQVF